METVEGETSGKGGAEGGGAEGGDQGAGAGEMRGNGKWETRDTRGVATRSFRSDAKCRSIVAFGKGLAQSLPDVEEWREVGDGGGTRRKGQRVVQRIKLSRETLKNYRQRRVTRIVRTYMYVYLMYVRATQ